MIRSSITLAIGLTACLGVGTARADYVVYTDRTSFEAAIQGEKTDTFEELGPSNQFFPNGLNQTTAPALARPISILSAAPSANFLMTGAFSGLYPANGTIVVGPRTTVPTDGLNLTLPTNVYNGAGADVGNFGASGLVSFFGTTSQGESFSGSITVGSSALGFLGVATNSATDYVNSITFSAQLGAGTDVAIDNVSFGAVPEPASMALLVVGFATTGFCAVRRRLRRPRA